jgi:hypothetical protein
VPKRNHGALSEMGTKIIINFIMIIILHTKQFEYYVSLRIPLEQYFGLDHVEAVCLPCELFYLPAKLNNIYLKIIYA